MSGVDIVKFVILYPSFGIRKAYNDGDPRDAGYLHICLRGKSSRPCITFPLASTIPRLIKASHQYHEMFRNQVSTREKK